MASKSATTGWKRPGGYRAVRSGSLAAIMLAVLPALAAANDAIDPWGSR